MKKQKVIKRIIIILLLSDNLMEKEENPEAIKIKQEFFKNTVNDFKKMFVSYLEQLLK